MKAKTPLYILGLLNRMGPQHGYRLRKFLEEQVSDFADIKMPTVYYHLERLEKRGHVVRHTEQEGKRPERSVFTITQSGHDTYLALLEAALETPYRLEFSIDAALYFGKDLGLERLAAGLVERVKTCEIALAHIDEHRGEVLPRLGGPARTLAASIFAHHHAHHQAELDWLRETLDNLRPR